MGVGFTCTVGEGSWGWGIYLYNWERMFVGVSGQCLYTWTDTGSLFHTYTGVEGFTWDLEAGEKGSRGWAMSVHLDRHTGQVGFARMVLHGI